MGREQTGARGQAADLSPISDLGVNLSHPRFQLRQIRAAMLRHLLGRVSSDGDPVVFDLANKRASQTLKLVQAEGFPSLITCAAVHSECSPTGGPSAMGRRPTGTYRLEADVTVLPSRQ